MADDRPLAASDTGAQHHRDAHDADDKPGLKRDPADSEAKLDIELDETFPGSDPLQSTQPGRGNDPAPSSGYTPEDE